MQLFYLKILLVVLGCRAHRSGADYSAIVPFANGGNSISEEQIVGIPIVKDVSAMCSISGGIHGQIEFDRPFSGRIYSIGFDNVHECIYFNGFYSKRVLFTIPINNCGTHLTHNTREVVDMVENRVYVQMDKYTLTGFDHKYAFVCELSPAPAPSSSSSSSPFTNSRVIDNAEVREIRRHPSAFLPSAHSAERNGVDAGDDGDGGGWIKTQRARPIIPQNAPKGVEPALLFYGNQQWKVPPENINFRRTTTAVARNRTDSSPKSGDADNAAEKQHTHPTVIVPLAAPDDNFRGVDPFLAASGLSELEQKLLSGNDELYWNRIKEINRGSYAVQEQQITATTSTTITSTTPRSIGGPSEEVRNSGVESEESSSTIERTSIVPLYESITATPSTPAAPTFIRANSVPNNYVAPPPGPHSVVVLPFASQQRPTVSVIAPERTVAPLLPSPTILVQNSKETIFTSNISSANDVDRSIYLEIKRGAATASLADTQRFEGTVKIGEPITLAVHAKTMSKDPSQYNIFVHSCYSSGGTNDTRIRLIDNLGCAVHPQVISAMRRERATTADGDELVYYFSMYAFKFPNGDDVHFFCSVDISTKYNFPELCPASTSGGPPSVKVVRRRELRHQDDVIGGDEETRIDHELRVFNTTYVADDDVDEDVRSGRYQQVRGNVVVSDQNRLVDNVAAIHNPSKSRRTSIVKYATLVGTTVVSAIVLVFIAMLCLLLRSS